MNLPGKIFPAWLFLPYAAQLFFLWIWTAFSFLFGIYAVFFWKKNETGFFFKNSREYGIHRNPREEWKISPGAWTQASHKESSLPSCFENYGVFQILFLSWNIYPTCWNLFKKHDFLRTEWDPICHRIPAVVFKMINNDQPFCIIFIGNPDIFIMNVFQFRLTQFCNIIPFFVNSQYQQRNK